MRLSLTSALIISTGILLLVFSCKKEYSCENCLGVNGPPVANAGNDTTIKLPQNTANLDGSRSTDPENNITTYLWINISGPGVFNISNANLVKASITNLTAGNYLFELKVTDAGGLFSLDTVQVNVTNNLPPVARAGNDTTFQNNDANCTPGPGTIILNGNNSIDPDGNIASYLWTGIGTIADPNAATTSATGSISTLNRFILKVTDNNGAFSFDTVDITIVSADRLLLPAQLIPFGRLSGPKSIVSVGAAGNKIVFAGGYDGIYGVSTVDIYDVVTHVWSTAQLSAPRFDMAVTTSGNKIFFGGGYYTDGWTFELSDKVDIYDASTDTWSVDSLSTPRSGLTAASVGNKVFFAGGTTPNYTIAYSYTVDIYDLTTNRWSVAQLSEARGYLSAVTVNNKIFFAGGENGYYTFSNRIDIYDNITSSWSTKSLNEPKARMANIAVDGKIYWAGGINSFLPSLNTVNTSTQVEIHEPGIQLSSFACLFQPNYWDYPHHGAVSKNNKIIFFAGGGAAINKFDIYDIASNTWSIGVLNQNIHSTSIISVNNSIYVVGGVTEMVAGSWSDKVWKLEF